MTQQFYELTRIENHTHKNVLINKDRIIAIENYDEDFWWFYFEKDVWAIAQDSLLEHFMLSETLKASNHNSKEVVKELDPLFCVPHKDNCRNLLNMFHTYQREKNFKTIDKIFEDAICALDSDSKYLDKGKECALGLVTYLRVNNSYASELKNYKGLLESVKAYLIVTGQNYKEILQGLL